MTIPRNRVSAAATPDTRPCRWCGRPFVVVVGAAGRPREFCRRSCRQRHYEARRRAQELGLGEHELVVARGELEALRDKLYVLACAVEDVERDVDDTTDMAELRDALAWLLDAARDTIGAIASQ